MYKVFSYYFESKSDEYIICIRFQRFYKDIQVEEEVL